MDLLLETLDLPITRDEYIAQAKKLEHLFVKAVVLPGVNDLIKHLTAVNIPCAVLLLLLENLNNSKFTVNRWPQVLHKSHSVLNQPATPIFSLNLMR